jgi:threonine 3-dehydrogenase
MPATMLAIRKLKSEPGLWWQDDTPVPRIGPREVLVAVTHAGICGTDRHIYEWDAWSRSRVWWASPPGTSSSAASLRRRAVTRAHVGQRVSAEGHIGCGVCQPCRTGNGHICEKVDILGIDCNGCFAQYVAVPEENIWPVHPSIPDHIAAFSIRWATPCTP